MNKKMPDMQFPHCKEGRKTQKRPTIEDIWEMYLHGKQTIAQISETTGLSASTVTRRLASISFSWEQPRIKGSGVIHLDATYFGRNTGVLLALESGSGRLLYMKHIAHEPISEYEDAVKHSKAVYRPFGIQNTDVPVPHGGDNKKKTDQESAT